MTDSGTGGTEPTASPIYDPAAPSDSLAVPRRWVVTPVRSANFSCGVNDEPETPTEQAARL